MRPFRTISDTIESLEKALTLRADVLLPCGEAAGVMCEINSLRQKVSTQNKIIADFYIEEWDRMEAEDTIRQQERDIDQLNAWVKSLAAELQERKAND